jgi:DNA-binding SARP family transcriptional activator/Tfp pilus assembly protein PilF
MEVPEGGDVQFRLLGPMEATIAGQEVHIRAGKHRALLAALLLNANRQVTTSYLASRLWDTDPPPDARGTIQTYVRRLRRILSDESGQLIRTRPDGYSIEVETDQLDLTFFAELLDRAAAAEELDKEHALLSDALALWRGPALADVPSDRLYRDDLPQLTERRLRARERLAELDLQRGRHAEAISQLQQLTRDHPLRERAWGQLMVALYRSGRRAEALEAYRVVTAHLRDELGMDPDRELQDLHRQILTADPALDMQATNVPTRPSLPPRQLPAAVPGFTGRNASLRALDLLVSRDPSTAMAIATLVGPPGVGKTALAVHWAWQAVDRFPDGQLYVNLQGFATTSALTSSEALARLLRALGTRSEDIPVDVEEQAALYRTRLTDRSVLVVLDNAASSEQVRPLLPGERRCCVVITSRNELRGLAVSHGATLLTLDVLTDAESHTLLCELVGAGRVAAEPTAAAELATLCGHLPLALRIAAAKLAAAPSLRIERYVARLRGGDLLGQLTITDDPQLAVRATFDLSFAALTPPARRMFRLLGLVPGATIEVSAAAALAGTTPDEAETTLGELTHANLVQRGQDGRVALHDLLRRYAAELCEAERDTSEPARRRLFDFILHTADAAAQQLTPALYRMPRDPADPAVRPLGFTSPAAAAGWLADERENLVAAARNAAERGPRRYAWQLADSLRGYFHCSAELADWLVVAEAGLRAALDEQDCAAQGAMHHSLGMRYCSLGAYRQAALSYREAITCFSRAGALIGEASSRNNLGIVCQEIGEVEESLTQYRAALDLAERLGNVVSQANQLGNLGATSRQLGRLHEAREYLLASLAKYEEGDLVSAQTPTLANLGVVHHELGAMLQARGHLEQALRMDRLVADRHNEAITLASLASVLCDAGRYCDAADRASEALALARETQNRKTECDALNSLARVRLRTGQRQDAASSFREALRLAREIEYREPEVAALVGLAETEIDYGEYSEAIRHALDALQVSDRVRLGVYRAKALSALAAAQSLTGNLDEAVRTAEQALAAHRETGHRPGEARTLQTLAELERRRANHDISAAHHRAAYELFADMAMPEADELRSGCPTKRLGGNSTHLRESG